jgi:hypothetical protein
MSLRIQHNRERKSVKAKGLFLPMQKERHDPAKSLLEKPGARQLQPDPIDAVLARLGVYSWLGIVLVAIWFVGTRPFCRHLFVTLCAMAFATLMLPTEMMFFVRHPVLALAVPLAAGFVAANLGRGAIRTIAAGTVLAVLAVAVYRIAVADPATGPWLRSHVDVAVPTPRVSKLERS